MNRRNFISVVPATAIGLSLPQSSWAVGEKRDGKNYGVSASGINAVTKIGKWSLEEIKDIFEKEYNEKIMPYWNGKEEPVVDWKYGGYLFNSNSTRREIPKDAKCLYYQGRILWLYSYFYNYFGKNDYHLHAAKCGYDFLTKYTQDFGPEGFGWVDVLSRDKRCPRYRCSYRYPDGACGVL